MVEVCFYHYQFFFILHCISFCILLYCPVNFVRFASRHMCLFLRISNVFNVFCLRVNYVNCTQFVHRSMTRLEVADGGTASRYVW